MKLLESLKLLPRAEHSSFRLYLASPVSNKRRDLIRLFDHYCESNLRQIDREKAFAAACPDQSFIEKDWWLINSRLLKLLQEYFAIKEFKADKVESKYYLARFYRRAKKEKEFKDCLKAAELILNKSEFRHTEYWLQKHKTASSKYDYIESQNRKERTNLQEVSDTLDIYYIASKLKHACQQISRHAINQENYRIVWIDDILAMITKEKSYLNTPAIAVYYYCYRAVTIGGRESDFKQLRAAINDYDQLFPPTDLRDIYLLATNYCIRQVNRGKKNFIRETFELYRLSLINGLLLEDGVMPESTYNNLVTLAIKLEEFNWVNSFLNDYQMQLKPAFRESLFLLCRGKLLYAQGDYAGSLRSLASVDSKAPFLFLGVKAIQLKCYFDLQEWNALDSLLDTMRVYLQRRKNLGAVKNNYENFHFFMRKLLTWKALDKDEKKSIREKVAHAKVLGERDWILEKMK